MTLAYLASGSNLGDRRGNIEAATAALRETPGVEVLAVSSLIDNPAVGGPADSPAFLNGAIAVRTSLTAEALLGVLLGIEKSLGRDRRQKWEPRVIDLDLLLFGDQIVRGPSLEVPHPLMHRRQFVLAPLAEIAPDAVHPVLRQTVQQLLANVEKLQSIWPHSGPLSR